MSKRLSLALILSAAICLPAHAEEPSVDTVVATVGDTEITLGHMIVARSTLPAQYLTLPDDVLFTGILDQLIQQTALAEIGEANITKRDTLVMENERRAYLAGAVLDTEAAASLTDAALQAAYDERFAMAEPSKEFNATHILVETEEEAKALKDALDAGGDFTALAKEKSTGPSGANGGELGWFGLGMMVKPFEDAVLLLEPGQVSGPIQTQFGWHIVKLNETRLAEVPTLEAVREELEAEVQEKFVMDYLAKVSADAKVVRAEVEIDPALLQNADMLDK